MKITLIFYLFAVVVGANFALAKNEHIRRRRPIVVESTAPDSERQFGDQLASESIASASSHNVVAPPENYPPNFFTGSTQPLKKSRKPPTTESQKQSQKVQYITPEPYNTYNYSQQYEKENYPSTYLEYTYLNRSEPKKTTPKRRKPEFHANESDYNYYYPESKRINAKTPAKASTSSSSSSSSHDTFEKFYQPQSSEGDVKKEVVKNGEDLTYHYYYPSEESTQYEMKKVPSIPSSTIMPSTTRAPIKKKKKPFTQLEHTSTDPYQYPPVLQRPNEYDLNGSEAPHSHFEYKTYKSPSSSAAPSTIRMVKPTKKNNFYLPSSTLSPSTTAKPIKMRRPSTEIVYEDVKSFSLPPSVSTVAPHFSSTTRAPEIYKYSTAYPTSSSTINEFYIKPSSPVTPTANQDLYAAAGSRDRTVVIKPKVQYTTQENYEAPTEVKETVVYKFVDPEEYYASNNTETEFYYSPSRPTHAPIDNFKTPDYYRELNTSTQADMDFYNDFHKNYNYEYFTEKDAGKVASTASDGEDKIDVDINEGDITDDKQRATNKNMIFAYSPEPRYSQQGSYPLNLQEHEMPPPMTEIDHELQGEASKNHQYFVLYSADDEKPKKSKKKVKPQEHQQVVYHHHHHDHEEKEYEEDFQQFDQEFDSEFDSELVNSDNVRIVDPNVRNGRPIEFTKDDYLRHIKQAVVQYMKNAQKADQVGTVKHKKYYDDSEYRPSKQSVSSTSAPYKYSPSPHQVKPMASLKLPKNLYTADKLKEAIEDMQESPQVDLTVKKNRIKPFDLSAIDVGQSYQHVSQFDHSAALKNIEEFDQSHAMTNSNKPKLHFSQQTYHDINNLGQSQRHKLSAAADDNEGENSNSNLFKGYVLPKQYQQTKLIGTNSNQHHQQALNGFPSMTYDSSKLPRLMGQGNNNNNNNNNDDDDDENKVDDTIDAPIQIINGIPVANPYNIDLNTLKYMLGGIAQAEVNDQLKDLDESASQTPGTKWKGVSPSFGSGNGNPMYQVYGQQQNSDFTPSRQKKNPKNSNNANQQQQKQNFPLMGSLLNLNKLKNAANANKQRLNNNHNNNVKNSLMTDFSNWSNQMNKKQRSEMQGASSNQQNVFVLRAVNGKNKHARDDRKNLPSISRVREPARSLSPPPPQFRPKKIQPIF